MKQLFKICSKFYFLLQKSIKMELDAEAADKVSTFFQKSVQKARPF